MDSPNTDLSVFTRQVSHQETNPTTGVATPSHSSSQDKGKARATEVLQGAAEQLTLLQDQEQAQKSAASWSMLTPEDYNAASRPLDSDFVLAIRERKVRERAEHLAAEEAAIRTPFHIAFGRQVKTEIESAAKSVKEKWCKVWGIEPKIKARDSGRRAYDEAEEAKIVAKLGKGAWPWNEDGQKPDAEGVYPCTFGKAQPSDAEANGPAEVKKEETIAVEATEAGKTASVTEVTEIPDCAHNVEGSMSSKAVSTPPITRWGRPEPPRSPLSHKASMMPLDLSGRQDK